MPTRRAFLGAVGLPTIAACASPRLSLSKSVLGRLAGGGGEPDDEAFWGQVRDAFTLDPTVINFNNGGVSPSPAVVQDAMADHLAVSNEAPAYSMWRKLEPRQEDLRVRMASFLGCDAEEVAFTRNASESLQTCQLGFDLAPGDEVLTTTQDYGRMLTAFRQRERREGVVLKTIRIPTPCEDDAEVVRRFEEAITPRTKLILVCHMINLTGQVLPVRDVVRMARRHGVPVVVDGAHSLAHVDFRMDDLECDFFGSSLHKWLFAPHGTGLLYVRKERIGDIWPLMAAADSMRDDIRKFEEIGTHPAANTLAIDEALSFHLALGIERKSARMRYLRDVWAKRLLVDDRVRLHTSLDPRFSCGIATFEVEGVDTISLYNHLWQDHRILTSPIRHDEFEGLRVSPSVYSTMDEVDRFCEVVEGVLERGLSA